MFASMDTSISLSQGCRDTCKLFLALSGGHLVLGEECELGRGYLGGKQMKAPWGAPQELDPG